jgi:uncharacterized damage-inducible protein DinB
MDSAGVLLDAFGRIGEGVHDVLAEISPSQLTFQAGDGANTIAWLIWHLTRIQDDHLAAAAGTEEVWLSAGWADRFALPFPTSATGYGHAAEDVVAVRAEAASLRGYFDAVHDATIAFVRTLTDADLERIVDESWDPPVSLGVRLVSVVADDLQHLGQAAYVRGLTQKEHP